MPDWYINKASLKNMLNLLFKYYEDYEIKVLDTECLRNDIFEIIDNMISYDMEGVVKTIENLLAKENENG